MYGQLKTRPTRKNRIIDSPQSMPATVPFEICRAAVFITVVIFSRTDGRSGSGVRGPAKPERNGVVLLLSGKNGANDPAVFLIRVFVRNPAASDRRFENEEQVPVSDEPNMLLLQIVNGQRFF